MMLQKSYMYHTYKDLIYQSTIDNDRYFVWQTAVVFGKSLHVNIFLLPKGRPKKVLKNWFASVDVAYLRLEEFGRTFHRFLITRLFTTHFTRPKEENHCRSLIWNMWFEMNNCIVVKYALSWSCKTLKNPIYLDGSIRM